MPFAGVFRWLCAAVVLVALCLATRSSNAAPGELVQNGGFESGLAGWSGAGVSTGSCPAHSGTSAASISSGAMFQNIDPNISAGTYLLTVYTRPLGSTMGDVYLALNIARSDGTSLHFNQTVRPSPGDYTPYSYSVPNTRSDNLSVQLSLQVTGAAAICFDDISFVQTSVAPTPTATATMTPSPSPTAPPPPTDTPQPGVTNTPTPTKTPTATKTPTPVPGASNTPTPTRTPVDPNATPTPTMTPAPFFVTPTPDAGAFVAPITSLLVNPGFEEGLKAWQKYGGEMGLAGAPRHTGNASGMLTSSTTSTRWIFQPVIVDPTTAYTLSGYVSAQGSVSSAYLRVSWYASFDTSGRALATDDSAGRVTGAGGDFAFLSTGPLAPPPGAHSARVRAMLSPSSTAFAAMYIDDFSFVTAGPASGVAPNAGKPDDTSDPLTAEDEPAPRPKTTPGATSTSKAATSTRTPQTSVSKSGETVDRQDVAEVLGVRDEPAEKPNHEKTSPRADVTTVSAKDVLLVDDQAPQQMLHTTRLLFMAAFVSLLCGGAGAAGVIYLNGRLRR